MVVVAAPSPPPRPRTITLARSPSHAAFPPAPHPPARARASTLHALHLALHTATGAALVIFIESFQYAGKSHDFYWHGDLVGAGLADYALVSGLLSFFSGGFILVAVLAQAR